jgi:hypothetical protein
MRYNYILICLEQFFGSAWIRIDFGRLDPDPGRLNDPQKKEKVKKLSAGCLLMRAEGCFVDHWLI